MILPTNFSPKDKITLANGLIIEPYKRAGIKNGNGAIFTDTIIAKNYKNDEVLKNWIIFHSFIFNSHYTLNEFEKFGTKNLEFIKEKIANIIDYDDVLPYVYFFQKNGSEKIVKSYRELYDIFLELTTDKVKLIINYLTRLNKDITYPNKSITDPSYWQLMIYYSVIDKIIGSQPFCKKSFSCDECKRTGLQHHLVSPPEWIKQKLAEIMPNSTIAQKAYRDIIEAVKYLIRDKTVHESLVPTGKVKTKKEPGETIIYNLEKIKRDYKHDSVAVFSLVIQLENVARYLLLKHLFGINIFPIPEPLRSTTIVLGSNSQQ